ncbi:MAG: phosphate starvation-inducible protein PsiE [Candidatus Sericytochromatia bacterium]|nr:MAG: phosphate starvation-inducible protein PsiE [Candidatus Sericytochromatia bacterium]
MNITLEKIKEIDKSDMFSDIKSLHLQIKQEIENSKSFNLSSQKNINKIILLGTGGGSSIASKIVKSLLDKRINIPIFINQGYNIPKWVDNNTLAIAITASGNTEETLNAYNLCIEKNSLCVSITCGGKLKDLSNKLNLPIYLLPKTKMQARALIGCLFIGLMKILETLNILDKNYYDEYNSLIDMLNKYSLEFSNIENSKPLEVARKLVGYTPVIYSSDELLEVCSTRWKNQFGENSKIISHYYTFPEMNHDEIVGWEQEEILRKNFKVIFLRDKDEDVRNIKRMDITKQLLEERNIEVIEVYSKGNSDLEKIFYLIYFGDWVSIYLAFLRNIDPTPVDLIVEMKKRL